MSQLQNLIRRETLSGIFTLTGRVFMPILTINVIYTVLSGLMVLPLLVSVMGIDLETITSLSQQTDPLVMQEMMEGIGRNMAENLLTPTNIAIFVLLLLISFVISSYIANVAFVANQDRVEGKSTPTMDLLKIAANKKVFSLLGLSILISLIIVVAYIAIVLAAGFVTSVIGPVGILFVFLGLFATLMLACRFLSAMPALVHADLGVFDAISHSFQQIGWGRAAKYGGICILAFIALFVALMLILGVTALFGLIPIVGQILSVLVQAGVNALLVALMYAAMSAIYYKYGPDVEEIDDIQDHLIS